MFPLKDTICNVNNVKDEIQLLLGSQHFAGYLVKFPFLHYCDRIAHKVCEISN